MYTMRVFRDGQLVGQWPEPKQGGPSVHNAPDLSPDELQTWQRETRIELDARTGKARKTFTVRLPHGKTGKAVQFSAYAFNLDRVKSATATQEYTVPAGLAPVQPRAYMISIGVNAYENDEADWDLRFAANDAHRMQAALRKSLGSGYQVVPIELVSDYQTDSTGRKVSPRKVVVDQAKKEALRAVLELLSGDSKSVPPALSKVEHADELQPARPDDLVVLTVSSHGYTGKDGLFYMTPSDSGQSDGHNVTPALLKRWISSDELTEWLRKVDAVDLVMIVDTCHSASTFEEPGFKPGPMGSRVLGQLAHDKGIRILAASQANDVRWKAKV